MINNLISINKLKILSSFGLVLLGILFISCSKEKAVSTAKSEIVDDLSVRFVFQDAPKKIISLAPNITEMIYDLGLENHLVGDTKYCDYPEAAKRIEKVGDMLTFNFEKIVFLKPDLIFITVEGNTKETYDKFRELGLKVFVSNPRNYAGIKKTYSDIARIFSIDTEKKIAGWDSTVASIKEQNKSLNKNAMYVVEIKPIMLVGKNTFINEYMQFCGLKNIAEDSPANYPLFNREEVLKRNPDYIIYPTDGNEDSGKIKNAYPEWNRLSAIKNGNIIFVNRDLYSRPGPRFIEALKDLFNQLRQKQGVVPSHQK
jgi:iron complex transport system substrate-binding protein